MSNLEIRVIRVISAEEGAHIGREKEKVESSFIQVLLHSIVLFSDGC